MSTECPIRTAIQNALQKHKCYIDRGALNYFVDIWYKMYGSNRLEAIDKYVWILGFDFRLSEKIDGDGWEISIRDIKDLDHYYLQPDYQVLNVLKNQPKLVEQLEKLSKEQFNFDAQHKYKSWQRISTSKDQETW